MSSYDSDRQCAQIAVITFITYTQRVVNGGHRTLRCPQADNAAQCSAAALAERNSGIRLTTILVIFHKRAIMMAHSPVPSTYEFKVLAEIGRNIAALIILVSLYRQSPPFSCSRVYSFFFRASRPRFVTMSC